MRWRKVLYVIIFALIFCGCGNLQEDPEIPELVLRYADNQTKSYPTTMAAEYFAQLVEERTNGEICIRVYANGELGDEFSVFEQVQFGGVDMTRVSMSILAEYYPEIEVLQLPYLYDDADHMWRVLDGQIGEEFLNSAQQIGVIGLSWFDAGARSFYTSQEISTLEDLKGLQIRVQESEFMSRMVRLLGAVPVQLPYGDTYAALQTAQIDGAENNLPSYESTGHFEAAPYFLRDEHSRLPEMQIISTVAMEKIAQVDESYVAVIEQCAKESALYERELWKEREESSEQLVKDLGCTVTELEEAELEKFRQAVQPMYDDYPEKTQALIQRIQES